jgi:[1-hydroxy-2-(trimethylamino)ethyl]phosphonate dioxygenase
MNTITNTIIRLFNERGHSEYGGEAVTQRQHALQCATLARQNGASDALIIAALLHDIGHILHDLPNESPESGIDDYHEDLAARFLEQYFPPSVSEPVRLHVAAKRYMCTVDSAYLRTLSPPSVKSLEIQGGLMNDDALKAFEQNPFHQEAIRLRLWDDKAKDPDWITEPVEAFADIMDAETIK